MLFHVHNEDINEGTTRVGFCTLRNIGDYLVALSPVGTTGTKEDCALG